ncbi:porin [Ferrovibrio sp.]|uniref:porin n=1 Tax=Ferrovibrio sp. TaxID=1917215 RepID=UPI0035B1F347
MVYFDADKQTEMKDANMKKTLLLQTALVAAATLIVSEAAFAQVKAEPVAVSVGGYLTQAIKVQDREKNRTQTDSNSTAISNDAEIYFNIRGVLDNGTVVGGRVELEGSSTADQIDERYLFVERADIGRIELGSTDRAASKMVYGAPIAIPGYGTVDPTGDLAVTVTPSGARTSGNLTKFASAPDDREGINLYTSANRYFGSKAGKGLQLGVSYTPDGCEDFDAQGSTASTNAGFCGTSKFGSSANAGQISKAYTVAANYIESFGPVDVALFGGYNRFSIEADSAGSLTSGSATVFKSSGLTGYVAGTTLTYNIGDGSSVQFGGAYKREEMGVTRTGDDKRNVYTAGLRYLTNGTKSGSIGLGVDFAKTKADQGNIAGTAVGGEDEYTWYSAGLTYQVATGVLLFGGLGYYNYDDAISAGTVVAGTAQADNDSKATFGVVGMRLDF